MTCHITTWDWQLLILFVYFSCNAKKSDFARTFGTWHSTCGIRHVAFGTWHSQHGIRHMEFGTWNSAQGIRHVAFGTWHSAHAHLPSIQMSYTHHEFFVITNESNDMTLGEPKTICHPMSAYHWTPLVMSSAPADATPLSTLEGSSSPPADATPLSTLDVSSPASSE